MKKIGLLFDERLSHVRKKVFSRNMSVFKLKFGVEFLPIGFDEDGLIEYLEKDQYDTVLIPWHLYFSWKKAANFNHARIIGYFADQLLHFEFLAVPNYQNFILLDFYRFNLEEIEIFFKLLVAEREETEIQDALGKSAHYINEEWFQSDSESSICIDQIFSDPILQTVSIKERIPNLRFFITALWLARFTEKNTQAGEENSTRFTLAEYNHRIMVQLEFKCASLTSKDTLAELWPTAEHTNVLFREMAIHCDFLKIFHFPKTRKISITGIFLPTQNLLSNNGEVRGFWIENRI